MTIIADRFIGTGNSISDTRKFKYALYRGSLFGACRLFDNFKQAIRYGTRHGNRANFYLRKRSLVSKYKFTERTIRYFDKGIGKWVSPSLYCDRLECRIPKWIAPIEILQDSKPIGMKGLRWIEYELLMLNTVAVIRRKLTDIPFQLRALIYPPTRERFTAIVQVSVLTDEGVRVGKSIECELKHTLKRTHCEVIMQVSSCLAPM